MSTEFRVTLTKAEILMAELIGHGRTIESRRQGLKPVLENDSQEYNAGKQEYRDKLGSLGELAVAKAFNVFFPGHVNVSKEVPDVYDWEVRTIDTPGNRLIIRPHDKLDRIYVSVCVDMDGLQETPPYLHCWVKGYFDAKDLTEERQREWVQNPGDRGAAYFIPDNELKNCDDLLKNIQHPDVNFIHDETWDEEWKGPTRDPRFRVSAHDDFSDYPPLNLPPNAGEVIPFPKK